MKGTKETFEQQAQRKLRELRQITNRHLCTNSLGGPLCPDRGTTLFVLHETFCVRDQKWIHVESCWNCWYREMLGEAYRE